MANVYIVRAEDVRLISDGADGWISVPDIKLPAGSWTASAIPSQPAFQLHISHNGRVASSVWHGPHVLGGQKLFVVSIRDDSDKTILQALRNRLGGAANCLPFIRALRARPALQRWAKAQPWFNPVLNAAGRIVNVRAPLEICGHGGGVDMDGDEIEESEILAEAE